jgi:tetratricopeptide (TPR) repeat protein
VRDALVDSLAPHRRRQIHHDAAQRLAELGASPARVGHHLLAAGQTARAVAPLLLAAEAAGAVGAYRDALELLEPVRAVATGADRARLLALRADLLLAVGDPVAVGAYREALDAAEPADQRRLRGRLARAALMSGDLDTADVALHGIEPDGGPDDGEILLASGMLAYFRSDIDGALAIAEDAQRRVLAGERSWQVLDLLALQGLLAHHRGEWFHRIRAELRVTSARPDVANAVFDGYLCPAEYLLYGPMPYADVLETARQLRVTAQRSGALRAVAFATALIGEAALLSGELDLAERELREAHDLHRDLGSTAGQAHCLQRLAEVHLARGDRAEALELLHRAVPLARWSLLAMHLLQRIYGTMIAAAPDPTAARAAVDEAQGILGTDDDCAFCSVMLAVPAAIACADVGDLDDARAYIAVAERSGRLWEGTSWAGAIQEARAHVARADGDEARAEQLLADAAAQFRRAGQPLDADRCRLSGTAGSAALPTSGRQTSRI